MNMYSVGNKYAEFVGMSEGISTRFNEYGLFVLITFNKPTYDEVLSIKKDKLEIRASFLENIPYFLYKFKGLNLMDCGMVIEADTTDHISKIEDNKGYGLHIMLVDTSNGELKAYRVIGLQTKFSRWINEVIPKSTVYSLQDRKKALNNIFKSSSKYLWDNAEIEN